MARPATPPAIPAEPSPEDRIRQLIALSLCEAKVQDADLLSGWSSLDIIEAAIEIETAFQISLPDDDLLELKTIGDLVCLSRKALDRPQADRDVTIKIRKTKTPDVPPPVGIPESNSDIKVDAG